MAIEKETEDKIFEAAQKVFQQKGFEGARMQEIADVASINKSMLHYYYRNKDQLFLAVFQAAVRRLMPQVFGILSSSISLGAKIQAITDFYFRIFMESPQLPSFMIYEMNQNPERFKMFMQSMDVHLPEEFIDQIHTLVATGEIKDIAPDQFLINTLGMCLFPIIARNMVQTLFHLDDEAYIAFLEERKSMIPDLILNGVKP